MNRRDELVFLLSATQEMSPHRYKDMVTYLLELARMNIEFTPEECKLLREGYNQIRERFSSYYHLDVIKGKYEDKEHLVTEFISIIVNEYESVILELLQATNDHLLPSCTNEMATIPILLTKAIMQHNMAKIKEGYLEPARQTYETALYLAKKYYQPSDGIRLDVVHHLSIFYCVRMNLIGRAYSLAYPEFTKAMEDIDAIYEQDKNAVKILESMRDCLRDWRDTLNYIDATRPF